MGIEVPDEREERPEEDPHRHYYEVNAFARDWFRKQLWESDGVRWQLEDAATRRAMAHAVPLTPEQIRLRSERESLELSRSRVLKDLESATHPRRREQLQAALQHLDQKVAALQ